MGGHRQVRRFGGGRAVHEQALAEEMDWHIDELAAELEQSGMAPDVARREARRRFGDPRSYLRACRAIDARERFWRGWRRSAASVVDDLRSAAHGLRARPLHGVTIALTLALAIGMCTAIFSVVDAVILRPLALPEPERLMALAEIDRRDGDTNTVSPANFVDWRDQADSFAGMAAIDRFRPTLGDPSEPVRLLAAAVSEDFFPLLGVAPAVGRVFDRAEHAAPDARAVVIGDQLFRRRFGGDPEVVGRAIELDGERMQVVGVMPAGFAVPLETELWLPLVFDFDVAGARGAHYLRVIGRLAPGVGLDAAIGEMDTISRRLEAAYPRTNTNVATALVPLLESQTGALRPVLITLLAAVGAVLLIACANVASLALARAAGREREMALRSALGAGRGRLASQLFGEAAILSAAGGIGGLLLAWLATAHLLPRIPLDLPRLEQVAIDGRILLFAWSVTVVCTVLVGLAPALRSGRTSADAALRDQAAAVVGIGRRFRLRQGLVAVELALALVLLSACGLMLRSLGELIDVDLGFVAEDVLTFQLDLPESRYGDAQQVAFYDQLLERLGALPGVRSAAVVPWLPLTHGWGFSFQIVGEPPAPPEARQGANLRMVSAGYFDTLGVPLHSGRAFDRRDDAEAPPAIIVNQALVDRYFDGRDPLGRQLELGYGRSGTPKVQRTIVGVVGNVRHGGPATQPRATVYAPHTQIPFDDMAVALRADGEPMVLAPAVRGVVRELDPGLAVDRLQILADRYAEVLALRRFVPGMLGAFAVLAMLLAAVGLYGVLAQLVAVRTGELGVRRALGATTGSICRLVLAWSLALLAVGLVSGMAGAWASSRLLESLLFGVEPGDPVTLAAVAGLLAAVGLAACALPTLRAIRVDPARTLRQL